MLPALAPPVFIIEFKISSAIPLYKSCASLNKDVPPGLTIASPFWYWIIADLISFNSKLLNISPISFLWFPSGSLRT